MKTISIGIVSLLGVIVAATATNYCSQNLCSGQTHIGCGNKKGFASGCPTGQTSMVPINENLKAKIIASHNNKRNTIAGGQLSGFRTAVRMATMRWDDELALLASYNVKTCKFAHDKCRNTDKFPYSGQNLAKFWWSGGSYTDEEIILGRIDSWWSEYKDTKMADINKYPVSPSKTIGHFTVMAAEKNVALGCAAIRFPESGMNSLTFACNYATTNIIGSPIYVAGPTASKCYAGRDPNYSSLCALSEVYN